MLESSETSNDTSGPAAKKAKVAEESPISSESDKVIEESSKADASDNAAAPSAPNESKKEDETPAARIIDWDSALEQCGDEEDFLKELLGDLHTEATESITDSIAICEERKDNWPRLVEMAAHTVKGASANLMCEQIHQGALALEKRAKASSEGSDEDLKEVKDLVNKLKEAVSRFGKYVVTLQDARDAE